MRKVFNKKQFLVWGMILLLAGCINCGNTLEVQAVSFFVTEEEATEDTDAVIEDTDTDKVVKTKKITLKSKKITAYIGNKVTVKPVFKPANVSDKSVKYSSSNRKVATVNKMGVVTCKKKGSATITIRSLDGSRKYVKCKITVKNINFKARTARPSFNSKWYYSNKNIYYCYDRYAPTKGAFDGGSYCYGNCTWYACGRAGEVLQKAKKKQDVSIFGPNPYGIWLKNKQSGTYPTGKKAKVGALVVFGQRYGNYHIAVVEKIENGVIYVSESGYKTGFKAPSKSDIVFHYGPITDWNNGREIIGYIYLL